MKEIPEPWTAGSLQLNGCPLHSVILY